MCPWNLVRTVNPNGGVEYGGAVEEQFPEDQLLERILSANNVAQAWKQVRANKEAPGIDGVNIDEWLRRRIRMCYWKQWRYTRTKVRHLLKLGTSKRQAIMTALSRKGPWHLSRTMATQSGMTNKWLSETPCADPHAGCCGGLGD